MFVCIACEHKFNMIASKDLPCRQSALVSDEPNVGELGLSINQKGIQSE